MDYKHLKSFIKSKRHNKLLKSLDSRSEELYSNGASASLNDYLKNSYNKYYCHLESKTKSWKGPSLCTVIEEVPLFLIGCGFLEYSPEKCWPIFIGLSLPLIISGILYACTYAGRHDKYKKLKKYDEKFQKNLELLINSIGTI